jgi:hypothetical protein
MAYNDKTVITDLNGNVVPQFYNPDTDQYEVLTGCAGANKVVFFDEAGNEVFSTQLVQPIVDKLDQLTGTALAEENRKVFEAYDPLKQYYVGNKVSYEGSSYYVIVEPPIGTLPTNVTYFLLIAEKGDTGNGITNITDNLDGTITITYGEGQTVVITFIGNVASNIYYNNSTSGLTATTVQDAIDEIDAVLDNLSVDAVDISIADTGALYDAANVETALAEVMGDLNTHKVDKAKYCRAYITANQSLANDTPTPINWGTITNTNGADFAIIENGNIKITKKGLYQIQLVPSFASNTVGFRGINTEVAVHRVSPLDGGFGTSFAFSYFVYKEENTILTTNAHQNSGGVLDLNASTNIMIRKVI